MSLLLAFDFDGVVIDSIDSLKKAYIDFLSEFNIKGTDHEFEQLNGPSISEIVKILKKRHHIDVSFENLLDLYNSLLREAYKNSNLIDGIYDTLIYLHQNGIDLVLVTSSLRSEVEIILNKYQLNKIFNLIITGDDVENAKPFPDIYLKVKEKFINHSLWAIEDSPNGIKSATDAGLKTIFFDRYENGTLLKVDCRIKSIRDIPLFTKAIELGYCVTERTNNIKVEIDQEYVLNFSSQQDQHIKKYCKIHLKENSHQDEQILYYSSHYSTNSEIIVKAFWGSYRYFYYDIHNKTSNLNLVPLAVSGICFNHNGSILIAKRKKVTEYVDRFELVPSGGINKKVQSSSFINFHKQILVELFEETSIEEKKILFFKEVGIVKDLSNNVIDLCLHIQLEDNIKLSNLNSEEYNELSWVEMNDISNHNLIPTSLGIIDIINKSEKSSDRDSW